MEELLGGRRHINKVDSPENRPISIPEVLLNPRVIAKIQGYREVRWMSCVPLNW
ncbi:MAG: hypothetical protein ACREXR_09375 [Gammaproteobacteria bacterium]